MEVRCNPVVKSGNDTDNENIRARNNKNNPDSNESISSATMGPIIEYCNIECSVNDGLWINSHLTLRNSVIHNCGDCGINAHCDSSLFASEEEASIKLTLLQNEFHSCSKTAIALNRSVGHSGGSPAIIDATGNYIHDCGKAFDLGEGVEGKIQGNKLDVFDFDTANFDFDFNYTGAYPACVYNICHMISLTSEEEPARNRSTQRDN